MRRYSSLPLSYFKDFSRTFEGHCFPTEVNIIEVGPRDGLQNEKKILPLNIRKEFIERINKTGIKNIEIGSFVNDKMIPSMKDSIKLSKSLKKPLNVNYSVLVPNERKYLEGVAGNTNINEVVLFVSASDTFNKLNIYTTLDEAFKRFENIAIHAKLDGLSLRGSISCALGCPFEGNIKTSKIIDIMERYLSLGVNTIDIADTIGCGTRKKIINILDECLMNKIPPERLTGHFHDTKDSGLTLVEECMKRGINTFHTSIGGLGVCPYSPTKAGNLSTEKLLYYCLNRDIETNIDLCEVQNISRWIREQVKQ
jgi:hydroxymethylglutaryl-CoA lyase